MEGDQKITPRILIKVYIPLTEEEYNVLLDIEMGDIEYYFTVEDLMIEHGVDSPYTEDELPIFEDLFAN